MTPDDCALVGECFGDGVTGFSIGCLGAIAEFGRCVDDAAEIAPDRVISRFGAIALAATENIQLHAYQTLTAAGGWSTGLLLGVPSDPAQQSATALTELGPDDAALRERDRGAILFDLGAGTPNMRFCIRTAEPELLRQLRSAAGTAIASFDHPLFEALVEYSPQRVALSAAGRIEVYRAIPRSHTLPGPHTHLLPRLLERRRMLSANVAFPARLLPAMCIHPENALTDAEGRSRRFSTAAHARSEAIVSRYGDPEFVAEKNRVRDAVLAGRPPGSVAPAVRRLTRLARRVALRQLMHEPGAASHLEPWLVASAG